MPVIDAILDPMKPERFVIGFVILWLTVCYLISIVGGWSRLAKEYRSDSRVDGRRWSFQSGSMRFGTSYTNVLTVGAGEAGLSLSMFILFRVGHPPLLIPWSDLRKHDASGWFRGQRLTSTKAPSVVLRFRSGLIEKIEAARGQPIEMAGAQ